MNLVKKKAMNEVIEENEILLQQGKKKNISKSMIAYMKHYWILYIMLLPAIIYLIMFNYIPMYGIQIAFKDFNPTLGIWGSEWVGLEHFVRFFNIPQFWQLLGNTLGISIYQLVVGFPLPIILALLLNYAISDKFKKVVQTVTYSAHFISIVVLVGMMGIFLSQSTGIVNHLIEALGMQRINFLGEESLFKSLYVWSGIWQGIGWGSIIYIAALAGVNTELYEAATIDGANKLQKMRYIDIPTILPTATMMLILSCGSLMGVGFEKVFLLQNPLNLGSSEIIATYVYKMGIQNFQYSFSTAVGLFNNVINVILLLSVNHICKKLSNTGIL
ncbi:MAG: ABC transporter permease subunit [Clostridium sp.]